MGKIKVDQIEIESGNSIQLNNAVKIKSYDTAGISALTPSSGDLIYDSDNSKLKVYTGSAWEEVGSTLDLSALGQSIIPDTDITYDLGSSTYKFRDLYLSGSSINLGDQTITADSKSISLSGSLKLKQYTTAQIDALTGMTEGEMVYDTNEKKIRIYNSSEWLKSDTTASVVATGGTISTYVSGGTTYNLHVFTTSGTFEISGTKSVDYMIIGGGGGGGSLGGGGGAGGYLSGAFSAQGSTSYSIVIGGGGASGTSNASNGVNTTALGFTAYGGGRGGYHVGGAESVSGASGGSGGGGSDNNNSYGPGGFTTGQGNSGGNGTGVYSDANRGGGGGGGSATSGGNRNSSNNGDGGAGTLNGIDGNNNYWAAGGGGGGHSSTGGDGGIGGGGGGSVQSGYTAGQGGGSALNSGGNGAAGAGVIGGAGGLNTGSGGGGNSWQYGGGATGGGSGIVIIRWS
jgi:hypothetical protein